MERLSGCPALVGHACSTPNSLDYGLMLLAPALLLLAADGKKQGFKTFELSLLALLWLLPFATRNLASATHILLASLAILNLLILIARPART